MSFALPAKLPGSIVGYFGDDGRRWLQELPGLVDRAAKRWGLTLGQASDDAGTGYVCFARDAAGNERVLKVAYADFEHFTGVEAMRIWAGDGCVRLIDAAENDTEVLMECVAPGTRLFELDDEAEEARIVARTMQRLHRSAPEGCTLQSHNTWVEKSLRYIARRDDVSEALVPRALLRALEQTVADLESRRRPCVIHGDLHHENLLFDEHHGWTAIDPKGLIGDPLLDVGRYLSNHHENAARQGGLEQLARIRLDALADELGEPVDVVRAAALVDTVVTLGWEFEDGLIDEHDIARRCTWAQILTGGA